MTYDHWKTKSDLDDWAAQNQPPPEFVCPRCGAMSDNPNDAANGYCGRCHVFAYDDDHWRELISTIVERIGVDQFWSLALDVLKEREG